MSTIKGTIKLGSAVMVDGSDGNLLSLNFASPHSYYQLNTQVIDIIIIYFLVSLHYYAHYYAGPTAQNVFDADYIKLREITLGYNIPVRFVEKLRVKNATISGFARNIATFGLDNKNFDPEMTTTGSGNIQGFEGGNLPASRTFGFNLKLQF